MKTLRELYGCWYDLPQKTRYENRTLLYDARRKIDPPDENAAMRMAFEAVMRILEEEQKLDARARQRPGRRKGEQGTLFGGA
jgi:uncharacterized protein HemY